MVSEMVLPRSASLVVVTRSAEETRRLGQLLAGTLQRGDLVALFGELGAGKTVLAQGIAEGLGVPCGHAVTSPSYTLIHEYPGRGMTMYHMDLYRLSGAADLEEIGFFEYLDAGGVVVIEWAERIREILPSSSLSVVFLGSDVQERELRISGPSGRIPFLERTIKEGGL